jgi:hypothetical protein
MNREEFLNLVWRLEEILMHVDYLRGRIGKCSGGCEGMDADDDEGLCPVCCDYFAQQLAEEERLSEDQEYNEIMAKLNQACDEDKTGRYRRILNQSREGKIAH